MNTYKRTKIQDGLFVDVFTDEKTGKINSIYIITDNGRYLMNFGVEHGLNYFESFEKNNKDLQLNISRNKVWRILQDNERCSYSELTFSSYVFPNLIRIRTSKDTEFKPEQTSDTVYQLKEYKK